jgi:DGQHR domain-containing protein
MQFQQAWALRKNTTDRCCRKHIRHLIRTSKCSHFILSQMHYFDARPEALIYQRLIDISKIRKIRKYLKTEQRVFVNNIIVSLPDETELRNQLGSVINSKDIVDTTPVTLTLPDTFNSIGIIDGQHRVFAYHEGGDDDELIKGMREQQNLMVTGILFPSDMQEHERRKFEARLFLQINSNQTSARSDLKQEIGIIISPFEPNSIARRVVNQMNAKGPLAGLFEIRFFEKGRLKVTSIVSYAMRQLINPLNETGLFAIWDDPKKVGVRTGKDREALNRYVAFALSEVNKYLAAVKQVVPEHRWTADRNQKDRVLTTTYVNGFIISFRLLLEGSGKAYQFEYYRKKLAELSSLDFKVFKSSNYKSMGQSIYEKYFK